MEKLQQVCSISTDWGWFQEQGLKIIQRNLEKPCLSQN